MIVKNRQVVAAAVTAVLGTMLVGTSQARPISYSATFESPTFTAGALNGQAGWTREDGSATPFPNIDIVSGVNSSFAPGGTQSIRIQNNGPFVLGQQGNINSVSYAISPVISLAGATDVVASGQPLVHIHWDMRVDDGSFINETSNTWAMDVYDSTGNTRVMSLARSAIAAVAGGTPTSANIYGTMASGAYNATPLSTSGPASGAWGQYDVDINYLTNTYTASVNGVAVGGGALNTSADDGLDVNFTVNGRGIDTAFFDNFSVTAVPEPSSLALVGFTAIGLLARRRR